MQILGIWLFGKFCLCKSSIWKITIKKFCNFCAKCRHRKVVFRRWEKTDLYVINNTYRYVNCFLILAICRHRFMSIDPMLCWIIDCEVIVLLYIYVQFHITAKISSSLYTSHIFISIMTELMHTAGKSTKLMNDKLLTNLFVLCRTDQHNDKGQPVFCSN